jgi:hypothetical protein
MRFGLPVDVRYAMIVLQEMPADRGCVEASPQIVTRAPETRARIMRYEPRIAGDIERQNGRQP